MAWTFYTYSGAVMDPFDPKPEDFNPSDIAQALSMQCRYGGHVRFFYSVAQHSWLLSLLVPVELRRVALLHDLAEAYLPDLPRPIKQDMPEYRELDDKITAAGLERFGLTWAEYEQVKPYDTQICIPEMDSLMRRTDPEIEKQVGRPDKNVLIEPMAPGKARHIFTQRFRELFPGEEIRHAAA